MEEETPLDLYKYLEVFRHGVNENKIISLNIYKQYLK